MSGECPTCSGPTVTTATYIYCPECGWTEDHIVFENGGNSETLDDHRIIVKSTGVHIVKLVLRTRESVLIEHYNLILNSQAGKAAGLQIAPEIIAAAVKLIVSVIPNCANRANMLNDIMAGALYITLINHNITITEEKIARIFKTRSGISHGKNMMISYILDNWVRAPDNTAMPVYLSKNPRKLRSEFIRSQMTLLGLDISNHKLYIFIKCLTDIESLYNCFDPQTPQAKITGAIYYTLELTRGKAYAEEQKVYVKLGISQETMKKFVTKLFFGHETILKIVKMIGLAVIDEKSA